MAIKALVAIKGYYVRDAQYFHGAGEDSDHSSDDWKDVEGDMIIAEAVFPNEQSFQDYLDEVAKRYEVPVDRLVAYRMWEADV